MSVADTALVSGCSGFLGRALCGLLRARGVRVLGLARRAADGPWEQMLSLDLAEQSPPAARLAGVGIVFHLAAYTHAADTPHGDEAPYRSVNVDGTRRLLAAAADAGVARVVLASSVKAMGEGGETRIDESQEPAPTTAYGRTKLIAEREVLAYGACGARHAAVLRLPLLYGPGAKGNLARLIAAVDRGRFPPLPASANRRSMLHVEDAAAALLTCATHPAAAGGVFLATDGVDYSSRDIVDLVRGALGRSPQKLALPWWLLGALAAAGDMLEGVAKRSMPFNTAALSRLRGSACYDAGLIARTLDFHPRHTLASALPAMVADYREQRGASSR